MPAPLRFEVLYQTAHFGGAAHLDLGGDALCRACQTESFIQAHLCDSMTALQNALHCRLAPSARTKHAIGKDGGSQPNAQLQFAVTEHLRITCTTHTWLAHFGVSQLCCANSNCTCCYAKPWRYGCQACEAQSLPDVCSHPELRSAYHSPPDTMASALSMRTFVPVRTCRPVARPSLRARRVVVMAAPSVSAAAPLLQVFARSSGSAAACDSQELISWTVVQVHQPCGPCTL